VVHLWDDLDTRIHKRWTKDAEGLIAAIVLMFSKLEGIHITSLSYPTYITLANTLEVFTLKASRFWEWPNINDQNGDAIDTRIHKVELYERTIPCFDRLLALRQMELLSFRFHHFVEEGKIYDIMIETIILVDPTNMVDLYRWIPQFPRLSGLAIHASPAFETSEKGSLIDTEVNRGLEQVADTLESQHLHNRQYEPLISPQGFSKLTILLVSLGSFFADEYGWNQDLLL
jgi:hypothetical protein